MAIVEREVVALIGSVGRGEAAVAARVLERGVEHAACQVEPLAHGHLLGVRIGAQADLPGCASALGGDLDDAAGEVAMLDRRNAWHDLDAGDVGRADGARAGPGGLAHLGIVVEALPVDLDSRSEGSIAHLAGLCAQCDALVVDER